MIQNYFASRQDNTDPHLRAMLERVKNQYPENTALQHRIDENKYQKRTYRELYNSVQSLAHWLLSRGLQKGERVGLLCENRSEWCIAYLGVTIAGIVIVPLDILQSPEHVAKLVEFAELKAFISSNEMKPKWSELMGKSFFPEILINVDIPQDDGGIVSFAEIIRSDCGAELPPLEENDTASIIFTSGTTGTPKGVMLSHRGILANFNASVMSLPIDENDNFIAVLPFHHTYPTTCSFISPVCVGGIVTIVDKIVGPVIISNIRETGGTHVIGVPLLFDKIRRGLESNLKKIKGFKGLLIKVLFGLSRFFGKLGWKAGRILMKSVREGAGLGSIRLLVAGGGPLNPSTGRYFDTLGFDIVQGYGMSENGPLIATNTPKYNNFDSVGLTVKDTDIRILNADAQGIGEIIVKSPSLMKGYFKNPEATAAMFTEDGYLKTGDLGFFDKKGFLYINGRSKNLIVSPGGKNIFPEEIEAYFSEIPIIAEILIRGRKIDSKNAGEEVEAVCFPDFEALEELHPHRQWDKDSLQPLIQQEIDAVNRKLEPYKRIRYLSIRLEDFEKTSSQKIKRFLY